MIDLIEEWLNKLDHDYPVEKMKVDNIFDNRWRVSLYRSKNSGQIVPELSIFKSYFLHVEDGAVEDRTIREQRI